MMNKWSDKTRPNDPELPAEAREAFTQAASAVRNHRERLAKELEDPINVLVRTAAAADCTKEQRQQIVSTIGYLMTGSGLAIGFPRMEGNQVVPPGTPCSIMVKSSRPTTHWLVLRTRGKEGDVLHDSPALTPKAGKPTPRLQLVESIISTPTLDRERAKRSLGL